MTALLDAQIVMPSCVFVALVPEGQVGVSYDS